MMLFRSAKNSDLEAILSLAQKSGIGLTTLPKEKKILDKRLKLSSHSYKKKVLEPEDEYYLFVLENQKNNEIVGVSAIEAKTGHAAPFYSYKISKKTRICPDLHIRNEYELMYLVNDNQGRTELCTLFLHPGYRKNNNGLLLSKARFLFIAQYAERFAPIVIAELRGISDEQGLSPFWNNLGAHFFHMSFSEADQLALATNKQFIADLMPRNPIYLALLSPEAREVLGKPHPSSLPAMNILLKEGFQFNNYVDIFDAGPTIEAPVNSIKTIANAHIMRISNLSDEVSSTDYLIANTQLDFRAVISGALFNEEDNSCIISKKVAKLLKVKCGDNLCITPFHHEKNPVFR